jgi:hypothetical protein
MKVGFEPLHHSASIELSQEASTREQQRNSIISKTAAAVTVTQKREYCAATHAGCRRH